MRDHLVGIHVGRSAAAGLENVHDELRVVMTFGNLHRRALDGERDRQINPAVHAVNVRRRGLDDPEGADERPLQAHRADREVFNGAGGLRSIEGIGGHRHRAHAVVLDSRLVAHRCCFAHPPCSPVIETMHANRLIQEKSPYLLQHAHNPVDWYPWGEEAFEKARARRQADLSLDRLFDLPLVPRDGARVVRERSDRASC